MSPAPATIDISNKPELLRLAEEVRTANTPRLLRNKQETVTVLMPAETAKENDKRLSSSPSNNWKLERYAIVRLVGKVVTVSVETVRLVNELERAIIQEDWLMCSIQL